MRWRFLKWHGWALALALPLLALAAASLAQAADPLPAYDPNSPGALEAKAKSDSFTRDGEALRTTDLVKELERLDNAKKFKMSMAKTPDEVISQMWSFDDDDMRTSSYSTVLQKRGEAGDPYASFFYGAHEWDFCQKMQRQEGDGWAKNAKDCWQRVMPAMKRASDAQIQMRPQTSPSCMSLASVWLLRSTLRPTGT